MSPAKKNGFTIVELARMSHKGDDVWDFPVVVRSLCSVLVISRGRGWFSWRRTGRDRLFLMLSRI